MQPIPVTLKVSLVFVGPFLTRATAAGDFGIDEPIARNVAGDFLLPGTLVKGRLRQSWEELSQAAGADFSPPISELLGQASDPGQPGKVSPKALANRGRLHFSDFTSPSRNNPRRRHRIAIEGKTGAVKTGALQVIEAPFGSGEEVTFEGTIDFVARSEGEQRDITRWLERGLRYTTQMGAARSVGFGELLRVHFPQVSSQSAPAALSDQATRNIAQPLVPAVVDPEASALDLIIRPQGPFCLARHLLRNLYESVDIIPGNAIKGALIETCRQFWGGPVDGGPGLPVCPATTRLRRFIDLIGFSHAFPAEETTLQRAVRPPLSVAKVKSADGREDWFDLALLGKPCLIRQTAPEFSVDWKDSSSIDEAFGWAARPSRELRVRTAIDQENGRAADSMLFAHELVIPDKFHWLARLDLSLVPGAERPTVIAELQRTLAFGLRNLGKTKVAATVDLKPAGTWQPLLPSRLAPQDGLYAITLQTPALLCDPRRFSETGRTIKGVSDDRPTPLADSDPLLFRAYQAAWTDLSGDALALDHFYASQSLAGGEFLWKRFQDDHPYNPFLLTDPGSVFVLVVKDSDKARTLVESWARSGLPVPGWALQLYGPADRPPTPDSTDQPHNDLLLASAALWRHCPYIPQNGFGEVAVNLAVHWDKRPVTEMEILTPFKA